MYFPTEMGEGNTSLIDFLRSSGMLSDVPQWSGPKLWAERGGMGGGINAGNVQASGVPATTGSNDLSQILTAMVPNPNPEPLPTFAPLQRRNGGWFGQLFNVILDQVQRERDAQVAAIQARNAQLVPQPVNTGQPRSLPTNTTVPTRQAAPVQAQVPNRMVSEQPQQQAMPTRQPAVIQQPTAQTNPVIQQILQSIIAQPNRTVGGMFPVGF